MTGAWRNVLVLAMCQAVFVTGSSLFVSTTALVGLALAPDPRLATLPAGLLFGTAMLTTMPASLAMQRWGRRRGFLLGVGVGMLGGLVAAAAVAAQSFAGFCVGAALLGGLAGCAQYYRFAAADAVEPRYRPRAISWVLAGGLVAAFVGPNLAVQTRQIADWPPFTGSYLVFAALQALPLFLLTRLALRPGPAPQAPRLGAAIPRLLRRPRFVLAVLAGLVAYGTMNTLMTATPLAMHEHHFGFGHTASVIQWHVVGMFLPSFFSGVLIERFGSLRIIRAGALLLAVSAGANLFGESLLHFWTSLFGIGVGWNFLFVAGSALLTTTYEPEEKAQAQGLNDLLVFATVTATATTSGLAHQVLGWHAMNLAVLPGLALVLAMSFMVPSAPTPGIDP